MGCKAQTARSRGGKRRGDLFSGSLTSDCLFETNNASRSLRGTNSSVLGDTMKISIKQFAFMLCVSLASMQPAMSENISIATGGTGGVYYPIGGGIASVLSKKVPGMEATAEVTGGSVDNLKLIDGDISYIGLAMADASQDAYKGENKFKGHKVPLRTLMILYPNRMHVVTVEGRGINSMADLKGKHISTGSHGSATEVMAFRMSAKYE